MTAKAGESQGPSEIVLDSARWNIADYVTHELKGQFSLVKGLPHILKHLNDPAIKVLANDAVPHLRMFIVATQLQLASAYNPVRLAELVNLILGAKDQMALNASDSQALTVLLEGLGYSKVESVSILSDSTQDLTELKTKLKNLSSPEHWDTAKIVENVLQDIGNALNSRERMWLREAWVDAGGMESEGRAYALLAEFTEALTENVSNDPNAPRALKTVLKNMPRDEELHEKIAIGSDNVRGAIWSVRDEPDEQGVLRNGWKVVSQHLEYKVDKRYGHLGQPGINVPKSGSAVFLNQARKPHREKFIDSRVRFVGNGEEFFQQIVKLL